jgi:hypothetical protein
MTRKLIVQGSREIKFSGKLICQASDSFEMTDWDERELLLQLFSNDEGGFVASIEFSSLNFSIATAREAEHLDTIGDVEKFFLAFNPLDHVFLNRRSDFSTSSKHRRRHLSELYARLVKELLTTAGQFRDEHPGVERVPSANGKEVNHLLGNGR